MGLARWLGYGRAARSGRSEDAEDTGWNGYLGLGRPRRADGGRPGPGARRRATGALRETAARRTRGLRSEQGARSERLPRPDGIALPGGQASNTAGARERRRDNLRGGGARGHRHYRG